MKRCLLLDVVVKKSLVIFKRFAGEDEALEIWGYSLIVLDIDLKVLDGVMWCNVESNCLSGVGRDENLHLAFFYQLYLFLKLAFL